MDPSCKKLTRKFALIYKHRYTSLHTFLNLHGSKFCPQGESSYLELTKSYCSVQACSYLLYKSVDPVVYKLKKVVAPLRSAPAMFLNRLCTVPTLLLVVMKTMPIGTKATARQRKIGSIVDAVMSKLDAGSCCCINGEPGKRDLRLNTTSLLQKQQLNCYCKEPPFYAPAQ